MSIAGIAGSSLLDFAANTIHNRVQQFQQAFRQLGQDLTAGNLSAATTDFSKLQQPSTNSSTATSTGNVITQDFSQLSADLQANNITAAQQDLTKLQQDYQNQSTQSHHHHHHHGGPKASAAGEANQLLSQLGQSLQSGNLSVAQQAYTSLLQFFQQPVQDAWNQSSSAANTGISVNA